MYSDTEVIEWNLITPQGSHVLSFVSFVCAAIWTLKYAQSGSMLWRSTEYHLLGPRPATQFVFFTIVV